MDALDETIAEIRAVIFALQSRASEDPASLCSQIIAIADEMAPMLGFTPEVRLGANLNNHVAGEPAEHVLTVLREALSNAARHAQASQVEVSVEVGRDLVLRVTDDGTGIQPGTRRSGLANTADRAERLRGTLRTRAVDEATGTSTVLEWRVPLQ